MTKFICTSPEKKGTEPKRAIYYSPAIGKTRLYRQSASQPQKGLKLVSYKRKSTAEKLCAETNERFNDNFQVEEVIESPKK